MDRFPSRSYMTPRTRIIRRLYFVAAIAVILIITGITIFNLSDKTEQEQPAKQPVPPASEKKVIAPEQPVKRTAEPPRMVQQLPPPAKQTLPDVNQTQTQLKTQKPPAIQTQVPVQQPSTTLPPPLTGVSAMITEALALLNEKPAKVIESRDRLNELLPMQMTPQQRMLVKQQMSALADVWLFTETVYPGDTLCSIYKIQSGDMLASIGKTNNIPWEFLAELNKIRPEALQVGQAIKIIKGPFHARIFRSKFVMDLYLQDTYVKSFSVGLGKPGYETPTGTWIVKPGGKLIQPTWTDPDTGKTYQATDPDYPLGSRWVGLEGLSGAAVGRTGFAIHGTKEPQEIGAATSRGCIRLHNGNAILVYNLMMPGFSKVEVVD